METFLSFHHGTTHENSVFSIRTIILSIQMSHQKTLSSREIRILEHAKAEAERGIFVLQGAIQLLTKQQEDSIASRCCAVCTKPFGDNKNMYIECLRQLEARKQAIEQRRHENATLVFESCVATLRGQVTKQTSSSRLQFYIRSGVLAEWRGQKIACLRSMNCSACLRTFDSQEFASFLRRVDHYSSRMERDLHVHSEFHPITEKATMAFHNSPLSQSMREKVYL